jgi:hypothetical protein
VTARKAARQEKIPDFALMQTQVEAAMHALPLWLPSDVCETYIPILAGKYACMRLNRTWWADFPHHALGQDITPSPTARRAHRLFNEKALTEKQIKSQLSEIRKQSEALLMRRRCPAESRAGGLGSRRRSRWHAAAHRPVNSSNRTR